MAQAKDIRRVGITGSYGGLNLGDEAILQCIIEQLRASLPVEITVFSRNMQDTLNRHKVERVVPVRDMVKKEVIPEIERLDLLIFGGGGILFEPDVSVFLREAMIAQEIGVPVMVYAVGMGHLKDHVVLTQLRNVFNKAAAITVREWSTAKRLSEMGIKQKIFLTSDPAFLLKPEPTPDRTVLYEHLDGDRCLVGMSIREPGPAAPDINEDFYRNLLANAADFMVDRYEANVVFFPMEAKTQDIQLSHSVIGRMKRAQNATVVAGEYTSGQVLSIMDHLTFAVGMRLHFLIFAAIQGIPFVPLPYATKISGLIEELDMAVPPIKLVSAGRLLAYIDKSWDFRHQLKKHIENAVPEFQHRARETNSIAVQLLREGYFVTSLKQVG